MACPLQRPQQGCDFHLSLLCTLSFSLSQLLDLYTYSFLTHTPPPPRAAMSGETPTDSSSSSRPVVADHQQQQKAASSEVVAAPLSRYESQKRRDWNTFGQYLKNQSPPVQLSQCNFNHVLDFLRYLDQFGKTKVHSQGCIFFGQPDPPAPCTCPLRQAWGSLDALIGRLRAAYEEHGGSPETNPFGSGAIRVFLREVKDCQSKARGIPYKKKKKRRSQLKGSNNNNTDQTAKALKQLAS